MLRPLCIALTAAAILAGPAAADDFCTLGVPGCSNTYPGVQAALDAASAHPGADRVLLGSGTWIGNFQTSGDVTIQGSPDGTVLTQSNYGPGANYPFTLSVSGASALVRDLRIKLAAGYVPYGLDLQNGASAQGVTIDGAGAQQAIGLRLGTNARFSGSVDVPSGNEGATMAAGSVIDGAAIAGAPALVVFAGSGSATVSHSTIVRHASTAVDVASGALTMQDSVVDARAPGAGAAVSTYSSNAALVHRATLRNVTLVGHGDEAYSIGIDDRAYAGESVTVDVRDSVVANFGTHALQRMAGGAADLSLDHVDVFPAADVAQSGAGTVTSNAVIDTDPAFAADGFTPTAGSPLIDAGTPGGLDAAESPVDLAGNPRIVAFGCGNAIRDLGAIEVSGHCDAPTALPATDPAAAAATDTTAPTVTKLRLAHRRVVRFALSEAARVTVRVARPHHRATVLHRSALAGAVTLRLRHPLRPGRYSIRVLATDAAGNHSTPVVVRGPRHSE